MNLKWSSDPSFASDLRKAWPGMDKTLEKRARPVESTDTTYVHTANEAIRLATLNGGQEIARWKYEAAVGFPRPRPRCRLCDEPGSEARGLCRQHYFAHWKAGTLGAFPKVRK